jgi:RimJ/RimL family protein N-acetyltransferase
VTPEAVLRTARLLLRPAELADAPAIFTRYAQDPEVTRYLPWRPHQSMAETEAYLIQVIDADREGTHIHWAITRAAEGAFLGMISLQVVRHEAEVGFVLARAEWGQGYMTEALIAVLGAAFSVPAIQRVWGLCDVENVASTRVMEKAGMHREGLRPEFAHFNVSQAPRDVYVYAVSRASRTAEHHSHSPC